MVTVSARTRVMGMLLKVNPDEVIGAVFALMVVCTKSKSLAPVSTVTGMVNVFEPMLLP